MKKPLEGGRDRMTGRSTEKAKRDLKDIECFNCHKKGHYSSNCPHNALLCSDEKTMVKHDRTGKHMGVVRDGMVEGQKVNNIVLDTGCSRTLDHRKFVPEEKFVEGEAVAIRCAHGDTVLYPLAHVRLEVGGKSFQVEAAVTDRLPVTVLLGTDVPLLSELLGKEMEVRTEDAMVVTRARSKKLQEQEQERLDKEEQSGVQPHHLADEEEDTIVIAPTEEYVEVEDEAETREEPYVEEWMSSINDELFAEAGSSRERLTRSQKRENKRKHSQKESTQQGTTDLVMNVNAGEFRKLQGMDPTLGPVRSAAEGCVSTAGVGFFRREGLLYRRWVPPGRNGSASTASSASKEST